MIVAIMQPYFFPYIGYFQLMHAADVFVYYDDAQYMKGGWINRNRILQNGAPAWLTMPVVHASVSLPINKRRYLRSPSTDTYLMRRIRSCYARSPFFLQASETLSGILSSDEDNIACFNISSLTSLARQFGLPCRFMRSSQMELPVGLSGESKVIAICRRLNASCYVNPIGGRNLYDTNSFNAKDVQLAFLSPSSTPYQQLGRAFVPSLSILDMMMFNAGPQIEAMMREYSIAP